jgi:hypothetical protein
MRIARGCGRLLTLGLFAASGCWGAAAQGGPYLSDMPKLYPVAFANWTKTLPYAIKPTDWLARLDGVVTPIRDVRVHGVPMKFGTVCVPHDCGANIAGVMFTPRQDRVVALVRLNSDNNSQTVMLVGPMNGAEIGCLEKLIDDGDLNAC